MCTIAINVPGKPKMWIEKLNKVTGEVTFTNRKENAYVRDGSFYANSEVKTLKNPMMYDHEKYPELQFASVDDDYYD